MQTETERKTEAEHALTFIHFYVSVKRILCEIFAKVNGKLLNIAYSSVCWDLLFSLVGGVPFWEEEAPCSHFVFPGLLRHLFHLMYLLSLIFNPSREEVGFLVK